MVNKHQRIPKGQLKMDNPVELAIQGTQDKQKQNKKDSTISVGRHHAKQTQIT